VSALREELVALAGRIAAALGPPPVARVLLPPPGLGPDQHASFCAVQLEGGATGIAYALLGDTRERLRARDAGVSASLGVRALVEGLAAADPAARALGLAALNALTRHLLDRAGWVPDLATDSFGSLARSPGGRLGMVGFFPPLAQRAQAAGIPLTVLELKPELVREEPGLTVTLDPALLSGCGEIVCTSTVLLNDSVDRVLAAASGARELVVIGPGAGFVPDPLFARGVTGTGAAWVTDPGGFAAKMQAGEPWGETTRKSSIRRDGWPGVDALLERAARG
jgi:uncharacterized protein (DUF4213/DUF364 family)